MQELVISKNKWYRNEAVVYSALCSGIVITLVYWPLLNSIFCIALIAYWLFFSKKEFSFLTTRGRMVVFFSLLYVLVIIGSFYSADVKEAVFKLQQKLPYLIFPVVFGTTRVLTPQVIKNTSRAFIAATASACVLCLAMGVYHFLAHHTSFYLTGYSLVMLKNMHPVIMGLCCILSVIFLLEEAFRKRTTDGIIPYTEIAIAVFLAAFVLLVGNRSNLFTLLVVLSFYGFRLITKWKHRLIFVGSFVVVVIIAFIANPFLRTQWNDLVDFSKEKSIQLDSNQPAAEIYGGKTLRLAIWRCALDIIEAHPLTGVGTGDVYPALDNAYRARQFNSAIGHKEYNAHNQYLQESIAYGIWGGLLLIALIVVPVTMQVTTVYRLFLLCFGVVCLTEGFLELNKGIVWYAFFNSLLFFHRGEQENTEVSQRASA